MALQGPHYQTVITTPRTEDSGINTSLQQQTEIHSSTVPFDLHWLSEECLHQIQDDGTGLKGGQWNCTRLPLSVGQTAHPSAIALLIYLSWTPGTAITTSKQRSINKVTALLCFGTAVVERAPCRRLDRRVPQQLMQETQDSLVKGSPGPCIAFSPTPHHPFSSLTLLKTPLFSRPYCIMYVLALNVRTYCMLNVLVLRNST